MEPSSPAQQNGHASGNTEAKVNGTTEKEIHEQIQADVIVIGAGFSGITAMHRLRKHGLSVKCLEAGGGFGGVWYWNRWVKKDPWSTTLLCSPSEADSRRF